MVRTLAVLCFCAFATQGCVAPLFGNTLGPAAAYFAGGAVGTVALGETVNHIVHSGKTDRQKITEAYNRYYVGNTDWDLYVNPGDRGVALADRAPAQQASR